MIVVSIDREGLQVLGHSGYAENGKDIVCAGVSALLQCLVNSIGDLTSDQIESELLPGEGTVKFKNLSESGRLLVDSFFIGICMIADQYPEYVRITGGDP